MAVNWPNLFRTLVALVSGLALGIGLGLLLGWVAWPAEFTEADPTVLDESYQRDYTLMIAAAYSVEDDLEAAQIRLTSLGVPDINAWMLSFTVEQILNGDDDDQIRQLAKLASDMGLHSPAMDAYLAVSSPGEGQ